MASFNGIIERINNAVPELSNNSVTSIWRRIAAVFASIIDIVQLEMSRSEERIEYAARNLRVMGKQYYIDTAFAYQEGDPLVIVDEETKREGYAVIDTYKQIIKQVAVSTPIGGQIYIKVATADSSGQLIPLTDEQLEAFKGYMNHFAPIGIEVNIFSVTADIFNTNKLYIRYNPEYSLTAIQAALQSMLIAFQSAFNPDVPLYINDVENAIRGVTGIRDAWFDGPTATYTNSSGSVSTTPKDGILVLNAGYFNFNPDFYDWSSGITVFQATK